MDRNLQQLYDIYSPYQYPWFAINYFIAVIVTSYITRVILRRWSRTEVAFHALQEDKKRNVITYVLLLIGTTLAFIAQVYGGWDILFRIEDTTTPERIDWMIFSLLTIMVLYVWELIFRNKIRIPLLVHHAVTILLIQLISATFYDQQDVVYLRFALLLGFHATVEQVTFLALFFWRLDLYPQHQSRWILVAMGQAFILKTVVTVAAIIYFSIAVHRDEDPGSSWQILWKVLFIPLLLMLYAAQLYACRILHILAVRTRIAPSEANRSGRALPGSTVSEIQNSSNAD